VCRTFNAIIVAVVLLAVSAAGAIAAETSYPLRPIRIIVPYPPGGSTDPAARIMGQWFSEKLGQPVVIDNRPGAGATLGHALAAQATPDGHTLLLGTSGGLVTGPAFGTKVSYDPVKDLTSIGLMVDVPFLLIVHPSVPAKTIRELIELGKSQPGKIIFASPGVGTPMLPGRSKSHEQASARGEVSVEPSEDRKIMRSPVVSTASRVSSSHVVWFRPAPA